MLERRSESGSQSLEPASCPLGLTNNWIDSFGDSLRPSHLADAATGQRERVVSQAISEAYQSSFACSLARSPCAPSYRRASDTVRHHRLAIRTVSTRLRGDYKQKDTAPACHAAHRAAAGVKREGTTVHRSNQRASDVSPTPLTVQIPTPGL